jgi:hypothetical protein
MFLPLIRRSVLPLFIVLMLAASSSAQTESETIWTRPVRQLLRAALEKAGSPSSVVFDVENRAGLSPADLQQIRKTFDYELRAAKVRVVRMESAVAEMRFILSRDPRGLLWIAQTRQGTSEQLSMLDFPDPTATAADRRATMFQLQRTRLLSRPAIILDVAQFDDGLLVLGSEQISWYRRDAVNGTAAASAMIAHSGVWPRDLRGRLLVRDDSFVAFLPGVHCSGTVRPSLTARCTESDDPWPLSQIGEGGPAAFFGGARNHFTGVLGGSFSGTSIAPFYSAARLGESENSLWAFSGTDASTRFYVRPGQLLRTATSLGSDLATLKSGCGAGWQLIVTGDGDETKPDSLQAFELQNRDAAPVSEKLLFDGPITALWSSADAARAIAVVRNLEKEVYDAYSITLACR